MWQNSGAIESSKKNISMISLKKIYKIGSGIFLAFMIAVAVIIIISAFPIKGNIQIKTVLSGSMEPEIKTGSIVVIKPFNSYKEGDIITFKSDFREFSSGARIPVTHRIFKVRQSASGVSYITKGDANKDPDDKEINHNGVIGKVLFSAPYIGYVVKTAQKPYGFLALILIPAGIIIFDQVKVVLSEIKKMRMNKIVKN